MTSAELLSPEIAPTPVGDDALYEIVDDRRVELPPMGAYAGRRSPSACSSRSGHFAKAQGSGPGGRRDRSSGSGPAPTSSAAPTLAFVSFDRWPRGKRTPSEQCLGRRARPGRRGRQPDQPGRGDPDQGPRVLRGGRPAGLGHLPARVAGLRVRLAPIDPRARAGRCAGGRGDHPGLPARPGRPLRRAGRTPIRPDRVETPEGRAELVRPAFGCVQRGSSPDRLSRRRGRTGRG